MFDSKKFSTWPFWWKSDEQFFPERPCRVQALADSNLAEKTHNWILRHLENWLVVEPTPLKNIRQNGFIFPKFRGENQKSLSCHQVENDPILPIHNQIPAPNALAQVARSEVLALSLMPPDNTPGKQQKTNQLSYGKKNFYFPLYW